MHNNKTRWFNLFTLFFLILNTLVFSQNPSYYTGINTSSPTFVDDLKARIREDYTKVSYDLFDETNIANFASYDKGGGTKGVRCVYSNYEYTYSGTFTWAVFSREHTFCHSWMPTYSSTSGNEYADQHHLFPTHQNSANGVRSNHPLGVVSSVSSTFGEAKYGTNTLGQIVYEPRAAHKGDAARALLYMMLRYDDINGKQWDFDWLNNTRLPSLSEAPQSLALLLQWHTADPPDQWEIDRNDYIESIQGNRNPFIDHPEYVDYINFNNMTYAGTPATNTIVQFLTSAGSVSENAGTYSLTLTIQNPSPTLACSVQVALTSGNASDVGNYTTQTVVFPANSSANQTVSLAITDNAIIDGDKFFTFTLQNISGGNSPSIGSNGNFNLTVFENEMSLLISEYSDASDFNNEFIEIYNNTSFPKNVSGYKVQQFGESSDIFTLPEGTIIQPHGFLVIGRNSILSVFETFWGVTLNPDVVTYVQSAYNTVPVINGGQNFALLDAASQNIDPPTGATFISTTAGKRAYRIGLGNTASDWNGTTSQTTATPGALDLDSPLPVELTSFTASAGKGNVILKWATATETNNHGFYIEAANPEFNEWKTIGFIEGSGNSNSPKEYSFTHVLDFERPHDYKYRLRQVDNSGAFTYSNEILVTNIQPVSFNLSQNYPNPFNPSTTINYTIPEESSVKLKIFDILGSEILTIVDETQKAGNYSVNFNASDLPGGVYFYTIYAGEFTSTKKMSLIK